ncbi:circularly permuted type 2 ATP-grasp protein [Rarobacter faecitabidus]|uniref:Putative circularly permuted ATP-grasp superfamily protein n=1 Tax=Rarobacter faecitabidus TaxID=13243 RepID=A0A542ZV17_RARFA|nr:circularly permuted type 2 ATP-grasp protein [Rarobacter faecitabidus]TQL64161.1 putative circularly permuted ATP-grasp superfamily protein [Rarobacter faecitabidus]
MRETFEDYDLGIAWDEMFSQDGRPHRASVPVYRTLAGLSKEEIQARADALARSYLDQGVTFDFAGEERPFPLDAVPRVIDTAEWRTVEQGVAQRVQALEAFLDDVYGQQQVIRDGVVPRAVIQTCAEFQREAMGIGPANGVRAHVSGIDLIRDEQGNFRVLEDNVRIPSGVSYVISNRRAMAQSFPELFARLRIRPVDTYPSHLLQALMKAAPASASADPTVVVLTPGVYNSAYFEHSLLARLMGVELVEGSDLFVASNHVWMRTTEGRRRVDVIYRRVDDSFLDPVHFRADSVLGVPGILNVARRGNVTIANSVGNGVADDKLVYTYVPDLIRYYLSEDPILPNVDTWRLQEPEALAEVVDRLDELVVKPVDGSGGKGIVVGPAASRAELDELRAKLVQDPRGWIAQPVVQLSTAPTWVDGQLAPRHIDLRPFAVNDGDKVWVLPGGLTRVALPKGQLVVNSSQGGGSKDTWVLGAGRATASPAAETAAAATPLGTVPLTQNPNDLDSSKFELSQQQQQQEQ